MWFRGEFANRDDSHAQSDGRVNSHRCADTSDTRRAGSHGTFCHLRSSPSHWLALWAWQNLRYLLTYAAYHQGYLERERHTPAPGSPEIRSSDLRFPWKRRFGGAAGHMEP